MPGASHEYSPEETGVKLNIEQAQLLGRVSVWSADFAEQKKPAVYLGHRSDFLRMREIASYIDSGVTRIPSPRSSKLSGRDGIIMRESHDNFTVLHNENE